MDPVDHNNITTLIKRDLYLAKVGLVRLSKSIASLYNPQLRSYNMLNSFNIRSDETCAIGHAIQILNILVESVSWKSGWNSIVNYVLSVGSIHDNPLNDIDNPV